MEKTCLRCKQLFKDKPSHIHKRKYCSKECADKSRILEKNILICPICNKTFAAYKNHHKNKYFCSRKCRAIDLRNKSLIEKLCLICGKKIVINKHKKTKYCSRQCFYKGNSGPNNYAYKGFYEKPALFRESPMYRKWRIEIYKRDNYTCQICGRRQDLRANHIKKFSDYPDLRCDINNGILICKYCDYKKVMYHEPEWEDYFINNLKNRNLYGKC
jgi:endogenous inhibitor of DNA gyrase (YacG/DUF329 family)